MERGIPEVKKSHHWRRKRPRHKTSVLTTSQRANGLTVWKKKKFKQNKTALLISPVTSTNIEQRTQQAT